ncbi:PAS domain-containing sensor histidine kinase [Paeniglutamicibacter sp. ABSL32-1]|uniref:sensor histidine kinase n=1 Tax=Paeniglutamicibacter quisquiliarum TaxID=2849498 RepID=UPI001C2D3F0D|nr:ATP-binding protein [Paeniglutamicibacter quisquiliarum]MBV1779310.1 PAS domain-containing sensor histidine kinase [Paeniglutamicibacter quisquiliarum]
MPLRRKVGWSQAPMLIAVATACLLALVTSPTEIFGDRLFVAGVLLTLLNSVLAWTIPWKSIGPEQTYLVIPALGLISATLMATGAYPWLNGVSLLIAFPVFWFAWSGFVPRLTLVLSFLVPLAAIWLQLWHRGIPFSLDAMAKPLLIPLTILALATTTVIVEHNSALAERQLRATLATSRRQTRLLNAVLNAANVGVVVVDRDGHDLFMNDVQRFQHRHATPPGIPDPDESQLLVRAVSGAYEPIPELLDPEYRPVVRSIRQEEFTDELFALGPLDDPMYLSTSARSFFNEDGEYDGAVTMFKNITPLIEASKTRNRFLANVSHELRTPLTSILGYLELLEDDPGLTEDQRQSMDVLSRNTERLLHMVNDLLTAAAGQHQVNIATIDLGSVIHGQLQSMRPRAASAAIELIEGNMCHEPVLGDALRLGQVIDNLVSNAIKYSSAGDSVTVDMNCNSKEISVRVADTGRGLSPTDVKSLFTRFFRSEEARRSGLPGVGLGLAISHELVEAHGGHIAVESDLGKGTTMTVILPRKDAGGDSEPSSRRLGFPTMHPDSRR